MFIIHGKKLTKRKLLATQENSPSISSCNSHLTQYIIQYNEKRKEEKTSAHTIHVYRNSIRLLCNANDAEYLLGIHQVV